MDQKIAKDFVYMGQNTSSKYSPLYMIGIIENNQIVSDFTFDKNYKLAVGNVYSGALFNEGNTAASGINIAKYSRRFDDRAKILEWESLDQKSKSEIKIFKDGKNAAKISEYERILLPLRVAYSSATIEGRAAMEKHLLNVLRKAPRALERD